MSRDPQMQMTDLERMHEQNERNDRWIALYNAAREAFKCTEGGAAWRQALYGALIDLEERR
jgi:hypothetical protein